MKNNLIIKIIIVVLAVIIVGTLGFGIATKVINGEESTTVSSELVAPSSAMPGGSNAENEDADRSWNESGSLVQGIDVQTTAPEMPDEQPGEVETLADPDIIDTSALSVKKRATLVINAQNKLSKDYVPHLEEIVTGSGVYLEAAAAKAFMEMYKAALGQGLTLTPYSGYVSFERQQSKYNNLVEDYMDMGYSEKEAQALAARKVLPAGCSEHNAGLAVDFGSNNADFYDSAEYKWLVKNAEQYGFIERYTYSTEDETGVEAAPRHWRFVGSAEMAQAINESGLSFEEWMEEEYPYWEEAEEEESATAAVDATAEADEDEDATDVEEATEAADVESEETTDEGAEEATEETTEELDFGEEV